MKIQQLSIILAFIAMSFNSIASIKEAPPAFTYHDGKAVFVDFEKAHYKITYDIEKKLALVETTIKFIAPESGYPLFDLVTDPTEVKLDNRVVTTQTIQDPDQASTIRVIESKTSKGTHFLKVKHTITNNVVFDDRGVSSGFWMSDLNDRRYLEQYLPTNLEFDQYKMKSTVKIQNAEEKPHLLKTNGKVSKIATNHFEVNYPAFYTASSKFFHLFPEDNTASNVQFYYPSIDGRMIPVDIYTTFDVEEFVISTKEILAELEADYGPFPHNQLIIYGNSLSGGMEYCGATATSLKALGHELFHSYHARGLFPANGNAGWMDEAIARWRDNKYPMIEGLSYESTRLAGHSIWTRKTDRMAYKEGSEFLSWIGFRMNEKNLSLKKFLRDYFQTYKYTSVTTELFAKELSFAAQMDLSKEFTKYIYGKGSIEKKSMKRVPFLEENPMHPHYSQEDLLNLTKI